MPDALARAERMALVRVEHEQPAGVRIHRFAAGGQAHDSLDDADPGALLHLVVAEPAAGLDPDQDGAGLVVRVQDDRVSRAVRGLDRTEVPGLHEAGS